MTEPWSAFEPVDETPGLPSVMVGIVNRADAGLDKDARQYQEQRRSERGDIHEAYMHRWMQMRALQLALEGRPFDPLNPASLAMSQEEAATRVFDEQDRAAAKDAFRAKLDSGELHLLNVPADAMVVPRQESSAETEQLADAWLGRMKQRTEHAGVVARIRRGLMGKVRT